MNNKNVRKRDLKILALLIFALIILNYPFLDKNIESFFDLREEVFVERIIDGDTFESNIGNVRLLGINTPERGELFYHEAKNFLESEILNKTVNLEFGNERKDKYNRTLAYVFLGDKNLNVELVRNGFANYYFYSGRERYSDDLIDAWEECISRDINLCEKSVHGCAECIDLDISNNFIINNCNLRCNINNWKIKGEGREKFVFNQTLNSREKASFELDLKYSGGSIFLWDEEGRLVFWEDGND